MRLTKKQKALEVKRLGEASYARYKSKIEAENEKEKNVETNNKPYVFNLISTNENIQLSKNRKKFMRTLFFQQAEILPNLLIPMHTPKNIGLTHKQIADWSKQGLLNDAKKKEGKWRKFSIAEIAFYKLAIELRKSGISFDFIKELKEGFLDEGQIYIEGEYQKEKRAIFIPEIVNSLLNCISETTRYNTYFRIYNTETDEKHADCFADVGTINYLENLFSSSNNSPVIQEIIKQPYIQINLNRLWAQSLAEQQVVLAIRKKF
jgi:DNA-binding transcriptional MerR regulator